MYQSHDLPSDLSSELSHDESCDQVCDVPHNPSHDMGSAGSIEEEMKEDSPSELQGRKITRRRSLMSQASVKKLFNWKSRQEKEL